MFCFQEGQALAAAAPGWREHLEEIDVRSVRASLQSVVVVVASLRFQIDGRQRLSAKQRHCGLPDYSQQVVNDWA